LGNDGAGARAWASRSVFDVLPEGWGDRVSARSTSC